MPVDEDDIDTVTEALVLQAVIEEQDVAVEVEQCMESAFDAVLVDEDADAGQIFGQHVRFVAGAAGVEEDGFSVGDDARREDVEVFEEFVAQALHERAGHAFVAAAEDGDAASAILQLAGEHFGNGCLAGAADGEVADADYGAAEFLRTKDAAAVKGEPDLYGALVDFGESPEDEFEGIGASALAAFENDVDGVALEPFEDDAHGSVLEGHAAVVGAEDHDLRGGQHGLHGGGDGLGVIEGEAGHGGPGAAEVAVEGAGVDAGGDGGREVRYSRGAVRLVQPVAHRAAEKFVASRGESGGHDAGVGGIADGVRVRDFEGQPDAGCLGVDFLGRHEENEAQGGVDVAAKINGVGPGGGEAAESGGGGIVGMSFEFGAEAVEVDGAEGCVGEGVETVQHAEPDGHAATESAGAGDVTRDGITKIERGQVGILEKCAGGGVDHFVLCRGGAAPHGDAVVEVEGDAEAIEARPQVGAGGRDAHGDFVHKDGRELGPNRVKLHQNLRGRESLLAAGECGWREYPAL